MAAAQETCLNLAGQGNLWLLDYEKVSWACPAAVRLAADSGQSFKLYQALNPVPLKCQRAHSAVTGYSCSPYHHNRCSRNFITRQLMLLYQDSDAASSAALAMPHCKAVQYTLTRTTAWQARKAASSCWSKTPAPVAETS